MKTKVIALVPAVLAVATAQTTPYTDERTAITYQAFTSSDGYLFGIALPVAPSSDFIGHIVGMIDSYAGISLGGETDSELFLAAWANGDKVVSSFRMIGDDDISPEVAGDYSLTEITEGTFVNKTHFALTFVCKSCLLKDGSTINPEEDNAILGWATSATPPAEKASHASPLHCHDQSGFYGLTLTSARSKDFGTWAGTDVVAAGYSPQNVLLHARSQDLNSTKLKRATHGANWNDTHSGTLKSRAVRLNDTTSGKKPVYRFREG